MKFATNLVKPDSGGSGWNRNDLRAQLDLSQTGSWRLRLQILHQEANAAVVFSEIESVPLAVNVE
jgi:hypothetical protein